MRIAQIAPLWAPVPPKNYGGIEYVINLLCEGLIELGHEVTLFATDDCRSSARLHSVLPKNLNALMEDGAAFVSEYYTSAVLAEALSRQEDFDILHVHLPLAWLPFAALARTPCLFTLHSSVHLDDLWVLDRYRANTVAGVSFSQCLSITQGIGRQLPIVPNAIDFSTFTPSFQPSKTLAYLGRMSPEKSPLDAIRIAQAVGMPLRMGGVPQGHKEINYFEKEIRPLIDGNQVQWLGPLDHVQKGALLSEAAALLFPIQWEEPFGLVMLEALACGTPVLATNRGSVPELIENGVTGYIGETVGELIELLPATLALDRRRVRTAAEARFGSAKMVENYHAIYREMIAAKEAA